MASKERIPATVLAGVVGLFGTSACAAAPPERYEVGVQCEGPDSRVIVARTAGDYALLRCVDPNGRDDDVTGAGILNDKEGGSYNGVVEVTTLEGIRGALTDPWVEVGITTDPEDPKNISFAVVRVGATHGIGSAAVLGADS